MMGTLCILFALSTQLAPVLALLMLSVSATICEHYISSKFTPFGHLAGTADPFSLLMN